MSPKEQVETLKPAIRALYSTFYYNYGPAKSCLITFGTDARSRGFLAPYCIDYYSLKKNWPTLFVYEPGRFTGDVRTYVEEIRDIVLSLKVNRSNLSLLL